MTNHAQYQTKYSTGSLRYIIYRYTYGTKWRQVAVRIITQYLKSRKNNGIKCLFTDSVNSWQHGLGAHLF